LAHYLDGLNAAQRAAVENTDGPTMVIAGAGSGKTRVLTMRIAHLLHQGVSPFNVLALTFTNKAAREMKERITAITDGNGRNLWMGTFHSVFARILRAESEKLGFPSNFTIYDSDDSRSMIRGIVKELNLDDKIYKPASILGRISSAKNSLVSAQEYNATAAYTTEDRIANRPMVGQIYSTYQKRLVQSSAMDFDDLLYNTNILFLRYADILLKYQHKFKYIMVDEYQDTNFAQYTIIKRLAALYENVTVVGDDAQSIYSFRGADIQNILNFQKDYPDFKTFKLEQNYRSTQTIVKAANSIIEHNTEKLDKNVWTSNEEGEKIMVSMALTDNDEGKLVANNIFDTRGSQNAKYNDFAILYRTNAQSRSFEEQLRKLGIPYKIYGGLSFYMRKEIKDLVAYFRLVINPNDEEALKRIINYPMRGIGDTTLDKLTIAASDLGLTQWQVLDNLPMYATQLGLNKGTFEKLQNFHDMIRALQIANKDKDAFETAEEIAKKSGIMTELLNDKTPQGVSRTENLQELLNGIKEFVEDAQPDEFGEMPQRKLAEYIQDIALLTDKDTEDEDDGKPKDNVTLMTIHASKGLEYKFVYVVGLEEDLFPSKMASFTNEQIEEERRLFYVAVTRAEKRTMISYAESRFQWGKLISCRPSRFIAEIDQQYLEYNIAEPQGAAKWYSGSSTSSSSAYPTKSNSSGAVASKPASTLSKPTTTTTQTKFAPPRVLTKLNSYPQTTTAPAATSADVSNPADIQLGMNVSHSRFGIGNVLKLEGNFPQIKATILFTDGTERQLLLQYAKLTIV
jgi:DNA helicase II / ATP-dependent DNA helicase PcrA